MLDGAETTMRRFSPIWMLEIEDRHLAKFGRSSDEVFETFRKHGYSGFVYADRRWTPADGLVPEIRNYLFTPPGAGCDGVGPHSRTRCWV